MRAAADLKRVRPPRLRGRAPSVLVYLGIGLIGALLVAPWTRGAFVSDDWSVVWRNAGVPAAEVPGWFLTMRAGWYRPLSEAYLAILWNVFGTHALAYRLVGVALYGVTTTMVGVLGESLTGLRRIGWLAALVFAVLSTHAEPVLWIAASNELLAGLFGVICVFAYVTYRTRGSRRWLLATWLAFLMSVSAKETALGLPLALAAIDVVWWVPSDRAGGQLPRLVPVAPTALVSAVIVAGRMTQGVPYAVPITALGSVKNLVYSSAMLALTLPSSMDHLLAPPVLRLSRLLPAVTTVVAAISLLALGWSATRAAVWSDGNRQARAAVFGGLLWLAGLLPATPIVTERTTYLASAGAAIAIATVLAVAWRRSAVRPLSATLVTLYLLANVTALSYRAHWWARAAAASDRVARQVVAIDAGTASNEPLHLLNLPDRLEYAYAYRNAFPAQAAVLGLRSPVRVSLDTDARTKTPPRARALWYDGGRLVPLTPSPPGDDADR